MQSNTTQKSIRAITREILPDDTPDVSWLEQDLDSETNALNATRLEAFNRGDWSLVGVRATAEILVNGIIQTIESPGLWGIESDSGKDYFNEVYRAELETLTDILVELGFDASDVASAIEREATDPNAS